MDWSKRFHVSNNNDNNTLTSTPVVIQQWEVWESEPEEWEEEWFRLPTAQIQASATTADLDRWARNLAQRR